MPVRSICPDKVAELQAVPLSYPANATEAGRAPLGYKHFQATALLTRRDFEGLASDLMSWRMHERAGLRVRASVATAKVGAIVVMRLGLGPLSLRIPCRVVRVVDEPDRRGFTYGTLPGHPESGEERFVLERQTDGAIRFTVTGVSRPASVLARLGGPVTRLVQDRMTQRYLGALDRL
ncbi:DUF1990 family protein [Intrasporangium flavum]|uniref:DUF1990 family protein n=1 Tax=Intrasporangium flavum TaxID=1428657 RepID=UPI0009F95543|nr:DUF1990 domain-containing protein [Intrasporangium flavum]